MSDIILEKLIFLKCNEDVRTVIMLLDVEISGIMCVSILALAS